MAYPVRVFLRKSDGSYFQVRDSDLVLIDEWKWSDTRYVVYDFAVDTLGNIYFSRGDTYVRQYAEDGTLIKTKVAPAVRYVYETAFNIYGYVINLQKDYSGYTFSVHGYTKDGNLDYAETPNYKQFTYNQLSYSGIVPDDENASIYYVSRSSNIEKWQAGVGGGLLDTIDITPHTPINLAMINGNIVFGTTTKLCKVNKAGGSVTELSILWDAVTGEPVPTEDGLAINGIHVGRFDENTFLVVFYAKPSGTANPYKWFLRKYNLAGSQIGDTVDLGDQGSGSVSLGSYFEIDEISPSIETLKPTDMVAEEGSESVTFKADLTNGTGKCIMRGFQYYNILSPGTVWNIAQSAYFYDDGEYSIVVTNYLTAGQTYMVRGKAQNTIELVYGDWVKFYIGASVINIKAENNSTFARTILYGEILLGLGTIIERGFEYLIQDEEPGDEDIGTEIKETNIAGFAIGEYNLKNKELYDQQYIADNIVWWFRAYCKDAGAVKYTADSWMKNLPNVLTEDMTNINYNKVDGNGIIVSKGASDLTRRGFEVKHEYYGSLPQSWKFEIAGFEGEVEGISIINDLNVVIDYKWQGDLVKTVLETAGLALGAYSITIGQMEFGWPVSDNCLIEDKAYKCRAFASNEFGTVYGDEVDFSTWTRSFLSEDPPTTGEISIIKNEIIENLPIGITASRRGFRYGTTEAADEFDVHENGSFTNGPYSMMLTDLLPDTTYYIYAYIVVEGIVYEGALETITTDPEDTEDSDEYPTPHYSPHGQDYREMETKVFAEVLASQGIIDFSGGKKTLSIINHLIQMNPEAKTIADNYLNRFKLAKTRMSVSYPTPLPFEREDTIDFSFGKVKFKENDLGVITFKEDGQGVLGFTDQITMIIKQINSIGLTKTPENIEYVADLDLEHE